MGQNPPVAKWNWKYATAISPDNTKATGGFWPTVNQGVAAVLYCFVFLYLSAAGGGPWSLDAVRNKA